MYKYNIETPGAEDIFARNNGRLVGRTRAYFTSNIGGTCIVNAVTGDVYTDRVGSKAEEKYFRVIDTTGRYDVNGRSVGQNCNNPNPNKLFYLTKAQYLEHMVNKNREFDEDGMANYNTDGEDECDNDDDLCDHEY